MDSLGVVVAGVWALLTVLVATWAMADRWRLKRRNVELMALHEAALEVHRGSNLVELLQTVVDRARALVGARYGALSVFSGEGDLRSFVTSGMDADMVARLKTPPSHRGVLGLVTHGGRPLMLRDLTRHEKFAGFPEGHPTMRSLLAVPIQCSGPFRGNLYLTERVGGPSFTEFDRRSLERFARQAATAIDNVHLNEQFRSLAIAEERLRIAHEMHDGFAQVLAYVSMKAQAARQFLKTGQGPEVQAHLEQMEGAAREGYADVREGILALRAASSAPAALGQTLDKYVNQWQTQLVFTVDARVDATLSLHPEAELQVLRVAQEALANVRKHSKARRVKIRFELVDEQVILLVEDDGIGVDRSLAGRTRGEPPRFGLATMRERARSIGASIAIEPRPEGGTRVVLELPLKKAGVTRAL
jgi:signal transduction histidine kinase